MPATPRCQYCNKLIDTKLTDGSFFAYKIIKDDPPSVNVVFTHVDCFFERFNFLNKSYESFNQRLINVESIVNES